ncbi:MULTISPECIES: two-component system response regulator NarL [Marinobacter]|uniref:Two-component system response regulator NarL n=1 Tax=Marinobacter xestospongiae TaxID=994319 RepID=A0ABU3W423_9GAMM|nr:MULTISPECIES: two-component system response regulator NarL [Marinobacter]MCG8519954.1 two-component system response regulator NarL [Pseudomonadales bacterium]MDV2080927.1 two-component system response regulator NarL [Marinobacter xestospongiae]UDL05974.1 two-component system response regulator NarL [Marinobacter sp. CA1]
MPDTDAPASILLIDDHPLLRQGIKQLVDLEDDMEVVGEASNARDGIALARDIEPDLILLDLNMPEMNGIDTLKALRADEIGSRIIIFTVSDHEDDVVAALRAGADGYLLKDMEPDDLVPQLRQAALGRMAISDRLTALLAEALRSQKPETERADYASLTPREKDILKLIAEGLSNKMIGRKLNISDGTVKVHVKHLLKKLKLRSRVEVAVWAVEEGLHR